MLLIKWKLQYLNQEIKIPIVKRTECSSSEKQLLLCWTTNWMPQTCWGKNSSFSTV